MRTATENSNVLGDAGVSPPWRVELFDGPVVNRTGHPRGERVRAVNSAVLLAYVACPPRRSISRETLINLLWPDAPPAAGRDRLSFVLSALRKENALPIEADRLDVSLPSALLSCDVDDFVASLVRADAAGNDDALRSMHLREAVAVSAAEFLPGLLQDWVIDERRRLSERRLKALCDLSACRSRLGDSELAIELARQAIALDAWDERGHEALLRALVSAGRSAAATRHLRELEARWRGEFGEGLPDSLNGLLSGGNSLTPLPPLSQAKEGESGGEGGVSIVGAPVAATVSIMELPPRSLAREGGRGGERIPLPLTRFFGREAELRLIEARLSPTANTPPARLITLLGSGGSGKTRLALEAAARLREAETFAGNVYFVPLADSLPTPDALAGAIRVALPNTASTHSADGGDAAAMVAAAIGPAPTLLVLDNFEHLAEADAVTGFLARLLAASPRLSLLVTSRRHLDIEGEQEIAVPPLPVVAAAGVGNASATLDAVRAAPGAQLLLDRIQAVRPGFTLTAENAPVVAALCERLEGIPLAIVLCAAWAGTLSPAQMLERLRNRFDLLVSRRKDIPERHRTLRATVEYSYQQLTPELERLLTGLSIFRGGWTLEAAEAVAGAPSPNPSPLSRGNDPTRDSNNGFSAGGRGENPEDFASSPLPSARLSVRLRGEGPGEGAAGDSDILSALDILRERSLIVADDVADGSMRYRMLETLREYAQILATGTDRVQAERRHAEFYLSLAEEAEPQLIGPEQATWLSRLQAEHDNLRAALAWCARSGDVESGLRLAYALRIFWEVRGYLTEGLEWLRRLTALAQATTLPPNLRAKAYLAESRLTYRQADYRGALRLAEDALSLFEASADAAGAAAAWNEIGSASNLLQLGEEARNAYGRCLELARQVGSGSMIATALSNLGVCELNERRWDSAKALCDEALEIFVRIGNRRLQAYVLDNLGAAALGLGDLQGAIIRFKDAVTVGRAINNPEPFVLTSLARVYRMAYETSQDESHSSEARALLREAITMATEAGQRRTLGIGLWRLGELEGATGKWERGVRLLGAADALREALQTSFGADAPEELESALTAARTALGDPAVESAWQSGRRADLAVVVSGALEG